MATDPDAAAMSAETFYSYAHPLYNRRYYLALIVSLLLFPLIAVALIAGTIVLVVPLLAFFAWVAMRVTFAHMLGNSILVSAENYPRIHRLTEEVQAKLGYTKRIHVFVYENGSFNASMRHFFFRRAIFLNSEILRDGVSDPEARWLIGRFVGYMRARQQEGIYGRIIRAAQYLGIFNLFILPYERSMVHTGDRVALAEIDGDLPSAISAMQKLLVGRELGYSINPEGLIAQHREIKGSIFAFLARVSQAHPLTTARYVDLILFTKAFFPEQFAVFQAANPGLPDDLERLGISQQTPSGAPRAARPPQGWAVATAMTVLIVAGAWALYQLIAPAQTNDLAQINDYASRPLPFAEIPAPAPAPPPPPPAATPEPPPVTTPVDLERDAAAGAIRINNRCQTSIRLALHFLNRNGEWRTGAWWTFAPSEENFLSLNDSGRLYTDNDTFYFYAESTTGNIVWKGTDSSEDRTYEVGGTPYRFKSLTSPRTETGNYLLELTCG